METKHKTLPLAPSAGSLCYTQQTGGIHPMLFQCWASVEDGGPTLIQHWVKSSPSPVIKWSYLPRCKVQNKTFNLRGRHDNENSTGRPCRRLLGTQMAEQKRSTIRRDARLTWLTPEARRSLILLCFFYSQLCSQCLKLM